MQVMKKVLIAAISLLFIYTAYIAVTIFLLPPISNLKDPKMSIPIQVKDWHGEHHSFLLGPKNRNWTPSARIPRGME